jgi:hypothetical protein
MLNVSTKRFGDVELCCYLRHMLYLSTPTSEMTSHQIRRVMCETINWCETNLGVKWKSRTLTYKVRTLGDKYTPAYGMYDPTHNTIYVFRNHAPTVKMVVKSVLHEYTHFLQNLRWYGHTLAKVGYHKHPLEREARVMELLYSNCWKDIKDFVS